MCYALLKICPIEDDLADNPGPCTHYTGATSWALTFLHAVAKATLDGIHARSMGQGRLLETQPLHGWTFDIVLEHPHVAFRTCIIRSKSPIRPTSLFSIVVPSADP